MVALQSCFHMNWMLDLVMFDSNDGVKMLAARREEEGAEYCSLFMPRLKSPGGFSLGVILLHRES